LPATQRDEMQASRLSGSLGKMQTTTTPSLCHQQIGDQSRFNRRPDIAVNLLEGFPFQESS
jgi:hypothetical protein